MAGEISWPADELVLVGFLLLYRMQTYTCIGASLIATAVMNGAGLQLHQIVDGLW